MSIGQKLTQSDFPAIRTVIIWIFYKTVGNEFQNWIYHGTCHTFSFSWNFTSLVTALKHQISGFCFVNVSTSDWKAINTRRVRIMLSSHLQSEKQWKFIETILPFQGYVQKHVKRTEANLFPCCVRNSHHKQSAWLIAPNTYVRAKCYTISK